MSSQHAADRFGESYATCTHSAGANADYAFLLAKKVVGWRKSPAAWLNFRSSGVVAAMSPLTSQIRRGAAFAVCVVVLTWLFFAPIAGFHHIIACGVLAPVVLNGETPQGDRLLWGEYEVRFFPGRFAASAAIWMTSVVMAFGLLHRRTPERTPPHGGPAPQPDNPERERGQG